MTKMGKNFMTNCAKTEENVPFNCQTISLVVADSTMFHLSEYFAKSLKVIENGYQSKAWVQFPICIPQ